MTISVNAIKIIQKHDDESGLSTVGIRHTVTLLQVFDDPVSNPKKRREDTITQIFKNIN